MGPDSAADAVEGGWLEVVIDQAVDVLCTHRSVSSSKALSSQRAPSWSMALLGLVPYVSGTASREREVKEAVIQD